MTERDARDTPVPATVYALCQALKPFFGPIIGTVPYDGKDAGNAFWMEAAANVWLQLQAIEDEE
jgi:hypothetical protein